jgi:hypothetical protein
MSAISAKAEVVYLERAAIDSEKARLHKCIADKF